MKKPRRITIALPVDLYEFVRTEIARGTYVDEKAVIRDALHLLREQEAYIELQRRQLRRELAIAISQSQRGLSKPFDAEEIKREGRRRLKERRKAG